MTRCWALSTAWWPRPGAFWTRRRATGEDGLPADAAAAEALRVAAVGAGGAAPPGRHAGLPRGRDAQRRPPGTGWAGGRGPVAPAAHHVHANFQRYCTSALKNQRGQLGTPGVLHDSGSHAALQAGGCLSVFLRSKRKFL